MKKCRTCQCDIVGLIVTMHIFAISSRGSGVYGHFHVTKAMTKKIDHVCWRKMAKLN